MDFTAGSRTSPRTSLIIAGLMVAGHAACGGLEARPAQQSGVDAPVAPVWNPDITFSSCERYATATVGSYVVASNYWNQEKCPGTQCIDVNQVTGAFVVTQGPPACGNDVASFPNVLYGCAYGNCSPETILPMPVGDVRTVTSSWDFAAGVGAKDRWNISYELWFCPDTNCGATGFPRGLELMVWLDYKDARGWKDHVGTVKLNGHTWDVWVANMAAGGALESWGYMNYILQPPLVGSVTDLDLNAFIQDAVARGYAQKSWYLYAIQAGMEVRTGGMPFISNKFSVSINGVTPTHAPIPPKGLSCDGGVPTADGQLTVTDRYVTAGPLHGYADAWAAPGAGSTASACGTPAFGPSALCMVGAISADTTYQSTAGLGFYLNQDMASNVDAGAVDGGPAAFGSITIPNSLSVSITKSGTLNGNASVRAQLVDTEGNRFCYGGQLNAPIPITKFNTACWNNTGDYATPSTAFQKLEIMVPSSAASEQDFSYCLTNVTVQ